MLQLGTKHYTIFQMKDFNPQIWWQKHMGHYPHLSHPAQRVLAIAAVEGSLSGTIVVTAKRTSLSDRSVKASVLFFATKICTREYSNGYNKNKFLQKQYLQSFATSLIHYPVIIIPAEKVSLCQIMMIYECTKRQLVQTLKN